MKRGGSDFHVCICGVLLLLVRHALSAPTTRTPTTPGYDRDQCIDDHPRKLEFGMARFDSMPVCVSMVSVGSNASSRSVVIERGSVLHLYAFHLLDCQDLDRAYVYTTKDDRFLGTCNMTSNPTTNTCSITCDVLVGNLQNNYTLYIEAYSHSLAAVVSTSFLIVHCATQKG